VSGVVVAAPAALELVAFQRTEVDLAKIGNHDRVKPELDGERFGCLVGATQRGDEQPAATRRRRPRCRLR
jgi:hypothetical protein